jgi:chromosome partitioning protein
MATTISFCSQKGGVSKSTLARTLAVEAARAGLSVKIADLDAEQGTSANWVRKRISAKLEPVVRVESLNTVAQALAIASDYDVFIIDSPGRASQGTTELARVVDLLVQPTKPTLDDMEPAVSVFHGLVRKGIPKERLTFALTRCGGDKRVEAAREYLEEAGYDVLEGCLYEQDAYADALDIGRAVTETRFKHLNAQADSIIKAMISRITGAEHGKRSSRVSKAKAAAKKVRRARVA